MTETIELGDIVIQVTRKAVANVHLSVHPPEGRVILVAPTTYRLEVVRAYAISKLVWIRNQQNRLKQQPREVPREFIERESHFLWGRRYLLRVTEKQAPAGVTLGHQYIDLQVKPDSSRETRAQVIHQWHKRLLHDKVPPLIRSWEKKLDVRVNRYFLQRMKKKWGSCNHLKGHIRLNTELVKKPRELLEYVILHEMAHLIEPTHNEHFVDILDKHYPTWREARDELNALPLGGE